MLSNETEMKLSRKACVVQGEGAYLLPKVESSFEAMQRSVTGTVQAGHPTG